MEIIINNETELPGAAREFLAAIGDRRHVALHGPMGAGKTTLTAAVCDVLGVEDDVTSPTFSIVNEYESPTYGTVFHFDFYRIEEPAQALDLGLDEYFDSDALCLMEWPENAADFLPEDTLHVNIEPREDGTRIIKF